MRKLVPLLAGLCVAVGSASSATGATLSSSGVLTPSFARNIPNYTTTCLGSTIRLSANVLPSASVQIGTTSAKKGSRAVTIKLSPNKRTVVKITESGTTTSHSIRCIPADFPKLISRGQMPSSVQLAAIDDISGRAGNGGKLISYAIVVDRFGVPIWWRKFDTSLVNFFPTTDGKLAFGRSNGPLEFRSLTGRLLSTITPAGGRADAHEVIASSNGTWLMGQHASRAGVNLESIGLGKSESVYDSTILKTTASGQTLWSWSSADHLKVDEVLIPMAAYQPSGRLIDLAHINSFEEDGRGGLIISARDTSAVYRIRMSDGSIDWKLGGTPTAESLTVLGDTDIGTQRNLMGQHDARLQPDGTLTIFDNGSPITEKGVVSSRPPRALRVEIDPLARTATVVESLRDPEIAASACCGNARRLSDGGWLVAWGRTPHIRGYDSSGTPIFWLDFRNSENFTYRVTPIIGTSITEAALLAGMDQTS